MRVVVAACIRYVFDTESGVWTCPIAKGINFANHTATYIPEKQRIFVIVESSVFSLDVSSVKVGLLLYC